MGSHRLYFASKALQLVLFLARTYSTRVPTTSVPHDAKKLLQDRRRGAERTKQYSTACRSVGPSASPRSVNHSGTRRQRRDKSILRTVKNIDRRLSSYDWSLPCLSADDRTLLRFLRSHLASFTRNGLNETILFIKLALEELRVAAGSLDDGLTYLDGYGFEHEVDEKFIANLQYLLNTICTSLSQSLARQLKATAKEEANQGDDVRNYRGMATFPDRCRPVSTTWPWTIKPSLAVLWGVCWMFYGEGDTTRVPQERIVNDPDAAQWIGWRRDSDAYLQYGREQIQGLDDAFSAPENERHVDPLLPSQPELDGSGTVGQVRDGGLGIHNIQHIQDTSIHAVAAPHTLQPSHFNIHRGGLFQAVDSSSDAVLNSWHPHRDAYATIGQNQEIWPQADKFCNTATGGHAVTVDLEPTFSEPWQLASERYHIPVNVAPQPAFRGSPSHLTRHSHISVQVQAPNGEQTAPLYDPSPVRSNISNATTPQQPYVEDFGPWQTHFPFNMGDVETQRASDVVHQQPYTPISMADDSHIDTSPRRHREAPRRTPEPPVSDSDESEEDQTSPGVHDSSIPSIIRRGHTFKRPGEPPKNRENKMICRFPECSSLTFERKCEWSKHMDKHERPYKCLLAGCEKLQGFTYSGGLLRHEREVHKMHGGTKASLYCPFQHCKRSSGNGFTRKENLNEHVRRVHRNASGSSNPGSPLNRTEEDDRRAVADADDESRDPMETSTKRKRSLTNESEGGETDKDDLREEIKRLRRETAEKDERLRRLEEAVRDLSRQRA